MRESASPVLMYNVFMDRTEVIKYIHEHYPCREEHPWADTPNHATFKHLENKKWFALVADVDRSKLGIAELGKIDFINLKNDPDLITSLRREPGILPAYHMDKEHWLTVLLDGSVNMDLIKALIETSFEMTE